MRVNAAYHNKISHDNMELGYLNEVKAILKSLVLSSPDKITVDKLNRDYREMEGEFIPFRRLGFNNLEQFLRSIPDTLMVLGSGHSACVYFVANEKSMHIHNMVMQQKKPKKKFNAKSIGRGQSSHRQGRNNNYSQAANIPSRPLGQQFSPFQITNRNVSVRTVTVRDVSLNRLPTNVNNLQEHKSSASVKSTYSLTQPKDISRHSTNNDKCSTPIAKDPIDIAQKKICSVLKNPEKPKVSVASAKYLDQIKQLENLLSTTCHVKAPATVLVKSVSFSPETERMTPEPLLKIRTEKSNTKTMEPQSSNEEAKVDTEENQIDTNEHNNGAKVREFKKLLDISDAKVCDMDEAVPAFAANTKVFRIDFPKHTVPFGRKIPPYKVPDNVEVGSLIRLFIAEIHNPFKFWFHIHKDEHELDKLMNHMERFYTTLAPGELRIPLMCLNLGQVCAACYNDMWHRAEIVAPAVDNKIKVSFVDYGTVSEVDIEEIKYLASAFAHLPVQALRGSLSHIKPRGLHWNHDATMHFLYLVSEIMLFAKITEIDEENSVFYMVLCDTNGKEVRQINKELVMHRYALYNDEWQESKIEKNNGSRLRHPREDFPTFSMIESGEYPSFAELVELHHRGIDYETIHDRIIFNKWSILNFHDNVPEPIKNLPFFLQTTNPFRTDILLQLTGFKATL